MAKVYADLIRKGYKTLDNVPAGLRDAVAGLLTEEVAQ
ncbi:CD1375 family protein [Paenibacillus durus]|nr:CD1375 family protein [Paenibacillus durus]